MNEGLEEYLGPYQDVDFIDPEETIDFVSRFSNDKSVQMTTVYFRNGETLTIVHGTLIDGIYTEYREGLNILMNQDLYSNNETQWSTLTNDRVLFYLSKIGSL